MTPSWTAAWAVARPSRTSATVGSALGVDVEVVRQVALRIEVDGERLEPDAPEDVRQGPHRRGLAGAALLGEDRDDVRHEGRRLLRDG